MTTLTEVLTDLSDLRRQRIEARQALARWRARYQYTRIGDPMYPHVKGQFFWWKAEYSRLSALLEEIDPSSAERRWKAAVTLFSPFLGVGVALGLLATFPALLVVAGVVFVAWVPWLVLSKLSNR
jgi:Flp pilus assembly protein TadB